MTYSSSLQNSGSLAVFNPEKLIKQIKQSQPRATAIIEIVDSLISKGRSPVNEARQALYREQPHQAAHMLHSIKGSINIIGGIRVVELIESLEDNLDSPATNTRVLEHLFDALDKNYQLFLLEAGTWLASQRDQMMSKSALIAAKQKAQVTQFKVHLENNNFKACDTFLELQDLLEESLSPDDFEGLSGFIHTLEFDKALQCIEGM